MLLDLGLHGMSDCFLVRTRGDSVVTVGGGGDEATRWKACFAARGGCEWAGPQPHPIGIGFGGRHVARGEVPGSTRTQGNPRFSRDRAMTVFLCRSPS